MNAKVLAALAVVIGAGIAFVLLRAPAEDHVPSAAPSAATTDEAPARKRPKTARIHAKQAPGEPSAKEPVARRRPGPSVSPQERLAKQIATFKANERKNDFKDPIAAPHRPEAIRKIADKYAAWTRNEDNKAANVNFHGVDCSKPPCLVALDYNADRGNDFMGRTRKWFEANGGAGQVYLFPHALDADNQRLYAFFSPYKVGTAEHHRFVEPALKRIRKQTEALPDFNPSRDLSEDYMRDNP